MKLQLSLPGLPPKKDGANSMWRKGVEMKRLKTLRLVAYQEFNNHSMIESPIHLTLRVYSLPRQGDLDNFITGICDGLMAIHPLTPIDATDWEDLPLEARPHNKLVFKDDALIDRIEAQRFPPDGPEPRYQIELDWDERI